MTRSFVHEVQSADSRPGTDNARSLMLCDSTESFVHTCLPIEHDPQKLRERLDTTLAELHELGRFLRTFGLSMRP